MRFTYIWYSSHVKGPQPHVIQTLCKYVITPDKLHSTQMLNPQLVNDQTVLGVGMTRQITDLRSELSTERINYHSHTSFDVRRRSVDWQLQNCYCDLYILVNKYIFSYFEYEHE